MTQRGLPTTDNTDKFELQKDVHTKATWALVMVYSRVENCGISSAGWFCSEMAEYWGGKVLRLKQKLHTHSLARKST